MWALSLVRSSASVTAAAPELVMSNSTAPAGTVAGLGSQPCDVIWILTMLDLSPAAAPVPPVDPLALDPELEQPAATRARLAASTAAAAPRRLALLPLVRTIKSSSRLTDRKGKKGKEDLLLLGGLPDGGCRRGRRRARLLRRAARGPGHQRQHRYQVGEPRDDLDPHREGLDAQ